MPAIRVRAHDVLYASRRALSRGAGAELRRLRCPLMERAPRFNSEHRSIALFALTLGVFLVTLNVTIVIVALPSLQADLGMRSDQAAWVIDAYNLVGASLLLSAGLPGRSLRPQADALHRLRALRHRRVRLRAGARAAAADRLPRAAGGRRHSAHADEPLDRRQPLSRPARARPRDRPLGRLRRARHRARADRRRLAHRVARLALGVRVQRDRRRRRARDRPARRAALAQRGRAPHRRRRPAAGDRVPGDADLRADRGAALRLRLAAHRRRLQRSRRRDARRVHRRRAAGRRAARRSRLLPRSPVRRRGLPVRRDVLHVRRLHLLQRALPAGRARLLGARRGVADAAGGAARADRRPALGLPRRHARPARRARRRHARARRGRRARSRCWPRTRRSAGWSPPTSSWASATRC